MRTGLLLLAVCPVLTFAQTAEPPKYTGPGSCASPSCHGGVREISPEVSRQQNLYYVQQNEYSIWVVKDKHARAFSVLSNDVAKRISRLMDLKQPDQEPRCLGCHSLNPPEAERARTFGDLTDGVSCESCHGPASNWLGKHTEKDFKHEQSVAVGMKDLRDTAKRTENCLRCHIGTKDYSVDHELIAAGHPDLVFELTSYTAAMPKHWQEAGEKPNATPDPWYEVRALASSEATQLQEQLRRVSRNANGNFWPEYADLDCFACHHSLTTAENSWQQKRGYPPLPNGAPAVGGLPAMGTGRHPGNPPWNLSRYAVLRQVISEEDPASSRELEGNIDRLYGMISSLNPDKGQVMALANSTAEIAERLAPKLNAATYDQARTLRLMKAIINNADYITRLGERPAEQSAMALQVLYTAYAGPGKTGDVRVTGAIAGLFKSVDNPSAYDAFRFADMMKALGGMLP
jgi:hypothetical protein